MAYVIRPTGLAPTNGYSHVVSASGTVVHVSGQVPVNADGAVVDSDDVEAQCEQVFGNLQIALAAVGASFGDVVKLTYYLTDIADLPLIRAVRDRYIDAERLPASSLVQVAALVHPQFRLEVDAVAIM